MSEFQASEFPILVSELTFPNEQSEIADHTTQAYVMNHWSNTTYGIMISANHLSGHSSLPSKDVFTKCFGTVQLKILRGARVLAAFDDTKDVALAYLVYTPASDGIPSIVHMCGTKREFANFGLQKALWETAGIDYRTDAFAYSNPSPLIRRWKLSPAAIYLPRELL